MKLLVMSSPRRRTRDVTQKMSFDAVSIPHNILAWPCIYTLLVKDCPKGYPLLAAFLDSDDNFMMYRRFGYLQARLLLEKQEQLRRLEEDLDLLDQKDQKAESRDLKTLRDGKKDNAGERRVLMRKIEKKFRDYGMLSRYWATSVTDSSIASLVQVAQSLTHCNRPSSSEHQSVRNFLTFRQPIVPSEQKFIKCKEDLLTLRPGREHAWLDSSVEKALKWMRCDLIEVRIQCPKQTLRNADEFFSTSSVPK